MSQRVVLALLFASLCSLVSLFGCLFTLSPAGLTAIYDYTEDAAQPPQTADAIVVLGGGNEGNRAIRAAELYGQGYAPLIVLSGGGSGLEIDRNILTDAGIPESAILINDQATGTWDEAFQDLEILQARGVNSALIVTDPFHSRRANATWERANAEVGDPITLIFVSAETPDTRENWWTTRRGQMVVLGELAKSALYFLVYGVSLN